MSSNGLILLMLVIVTLASAAALVYLRGKFQLALILGFPSLVFCLYALMTPFTAIYLYVFWTFLRPFDFVPALVPLKMTIVSLALAVLVWIIQMIRHRLPLRWNLLYWLFLGYAVVAAIGIPMALNNRWAFDAGQLVIFAFLLFVIMTNLVKSPQQILKVMLLLIAIHAILAMKGISNYVFYTNQTTSYQHTSGIVGTGHLADENDFALALNVMIPIAFFVMLGLRSLWAKLLCAGCILLYVLGVICSFSRGGWLGMVTAAAFCIWYSGRRLVGFGVGGVLALLFLVLAPGRYLDEIGTIADTKEGTADARIKYWETGIKMALDNPLIGVGPNNGGIHMVKYYVGNNAGTQWGRTFHGTLPQVAAELGFTGLALYLAIFGWSLLRLSRIRHEQFMRGSPPWRLWSLGTVGALATHFVTATFLSTAYYPHLPMILTLGMMVYWVSRKDLLTDEQQASIETNEQPSARVAL